MDVVTGAFGYIGKYISKTLLERGRTVCTITTHPDKPNPFGTAVKAFSYYFDDAAALIRTLSGAESLYNTYWIRFPFDGQTYEHALENTQTLFRCAKQAGVKRIVHIGVTRASLDSDLPYYRGKAIQESMLKESGVPFSIVRSGTRRVDRRENWQETESRESLSSVWYILRSYSQRILAGCIAHSE